ncbi:hypothetical protein HDV00_005397 [Rhizophlyctis rosea]|nr:hypothetical protein HDV00_005397 [Rhizophlyctis rosea]
MGAKGSKAEPIIIYNEPDVPIQFTPNLLRTLDGTAPPPPAFGSPFPAPPSQTISSDSNIDDLVKRRVQREVELHQQKRLAHEQRSADQVRREVEDLLRRQKIPPAQRPVPEYIEKQNAVIACYTWVSGIGRMIKDACLIRFL